MTGDVQSLLHSAFVLVRKVVVFCRCFCSGHGGAGAKRYAMATTWAGGFICRYAAQRKSNVKPISFLDGGIALFEAVAASSRRAGRDFVIYLPWTSDLAMMPHRGAVMNQLARPLAKTLIHLNSSMSVSIC